MDFGLWIEEGSLTIDDLRVMRGGQDAGSNPTDPVHYVGDLVIDCIEGYGLGFHLGNVVKYVCRHERKGGLDDLRKARWYLDREIGRQEEKGKHEV